MASDKPGKLKFNPAMFNPAAMKPGGKSKKLEELKRKRANAPTQPLKTTEDQFTRPTIPRRRVKSKAKLNLPDDHQDEFYNQSFVNNNPIIEEKQESKTDPIQQYETKIDKDKLDKLDSAIKDRKTPENVGYIDPTKISPAIQDIAKKLEHQQKADNINQRMAARQDIDEMLDSGLLPADPRKVHGSLHENQSTLSHELEDRASKQFLQHTKILKYDIDASIQPMADELEQKLEARSPPTPSNIAPALAATSKQLDKQIKSDKVNQSQKNRISLSRLQKQGIIPTSDNVAPSLAATSKQLDKALKTNKLSQSLYDKDRKTHKELSDSGVLKYSNLSNNLVSAAESLENQVIEDKLNKGMRNRPDVDELADRNILTTGVDPSLHATQNSLKLQQQKDKLHKNLRDRPDIDELVDKNIITTGVDPTLIATQNALKLQQQKDKLQKNLRNQPDIEELEEKNLITSGVDPALQSAQKALELQQKKDSLQQNLRSREDIDELAERNIITTGVDPSLHATQKELKLQQQKDKLHKGIRKRPDIEELEEKNLITTGVDPLLQSAQKALELQQKKDSLHQNLRSREDIDDLAERNIITTGVDPSLHATQKELKLQQQKDKLHKGVRNRPDIDELEEKNLITSGVDPALQSAQKALELQQKKDSLQQNLRSREDIDELAERNIITTGVDPSLQATQKELKLQQQKDKLHKGIRKRPDIDELEEKNLITTGVDPLLQSAQKALELQQKKDSLHRGLRSREDIDELADRNILTTGVDPSLHATQKELKLQQQKDKLHKGIRKRPDIDELEEKNLITTGVDPLLQSAQKALELQQKKDSLHQNLRSREDIDDLAERNIITTGVDPSLHATQKELKLQQQKDKLHKGVRNRPDIDELADRNIITTGVDPSLQATQKALGFQQQKDSLHKNLRSREDIDDLAERNIITTGVDPSLHATQKALKLQQQKDSLHKNLRSREDIDELAERNIITTGVDPSLQATQKELKMQQQKDKLHKNLRIRGDIEELTEKNIMSSPVGVDPSLHAAQKALKLQQQKDKLHQGVRNRADIDELHQQNIITPNVAPQHAAAQRELDAQKKKDIIRQKLTDKDRPTTDELEAGGVLYSQQIAPSLQSNAKDLEEKMREIQYNKDEVASTQSIDQSPTQTDIELQEDGFAPLGNDINTIRQMSGDILARRSDKKMAKRLSKPIGLESFDSTEITKARKRISKTLESRLSVRKTAEELENYGIVPPDYFDDPQGAYEMRLIQRKLAEEDLRRNLKTKPSPQEIVQRGLAHDEFWEKDLEQTHRQRRASLEAKKRKLAEHHKRRPSIQDLVAEKIMPEDSEVIAELKNIAHSHTRMESAVKDLSARLPFEDETNISVAETMMKHINDTEDDIDLLFTTSEEEDDDENGYRARQSEEESERDPDIDYDAPSDIEEEEDDGVQFDLDAVQKRNHKRRVSQDLEHFYANRRGMEELEDDGILKQTGIANSLRGSAVALEEAMNNQALRKDLISRNIIKRPSISHSLQPNADALEIALLKNLDKYKAIDLKHVDDHPLYKRSNSAGSSGRRGHQRKKSSGFGTKKNANPEYYKHDIAPKLQDTANKLHKRRISQQIERSLNARPTKQELIDNRILYKEHMAHQLQGNAKKLEEQLKQRVPEQYLKMIGVLLHDQERVAPMIQGASYELEYALRRRPSLFDGADNSEIHKILGIPNHSDDHHEFYTNKLFKTEADLLAEVDKQPLAISAFEEMYPNDNDKTNYRLRRARNSDKLEKRMSQRMSPRDLEKIGMVPPNYWEDPHGAIEMQQIHRKLAAEDLKRGLRNRSTRQELVDRGFTRAEYFDMDMAKAKKAITKHSKSTKRQVENQLNSIFNPQLIELEKRGIVESGYFLTRAKQIEDGHRRLVSVTSELQQKLLSNPSYNEELAKTLVQDLRSDSDEEGGDDDYDTDSEEDSEDEDESDTDSDEFLDSDDEEQARRLQELEYKIGHRPSTDELIEKKILYKKISQMAPSLQGNAQQLQKVIGKRPSIEVVSQKGILQLTATNQDDLDRTHVITHKKSKKRHKKKRVNKKATKKMDSKHAHLNKKLGRRRPTMVDLEKRGIVPSGYFDDVELAMTDKKIRKDNIIHDLASRLQSRPEFSENFAKGLMAKAMDGMQKQNEIINSGKGVQDKAVISQILTAKISDRMGVSQLKNKNILSSSYDPSLSHKLTANADALAKKQLSQTLQEKLNAAPTADEVYDQGYLKFKRHGNHGLSDTYQPVAVELEELIQQRPDEAYLANMGIFEAPLNKQLNEKIKSRPSRGALEQAGYVPHGAFDDLDAAERAKHDRVQSIHDELNAFFEYDRPSKEELIHNGIFNMPQKRRDSIEIKSEHTKTDSEAEEDPEEEEEDGDEEEDIYNSPDIPPVPERSSMFQPNSYTEIVMNSITFHNKKATEPSYSIDLLVSEPDLSDDIIQTSTLSFLNVLDNLQTIVDRKISYAEENFINKMNAGNVELKSLKNIFRSLQDHGLSAVEQLDGFESCGDVEADIDNVWKEILSKQANLYKLDDEYMNLHVDIKKLQAVKEELQEYCDTYKIKLSQLKRVKKKINLYILDNKMSKDSANEAMKATDSNQAWMISKITNKIVQLQAKIDSLNAEQDREEYVTCESFLNGLKEFLKGLKKLRKSSNDKIQHLQCIIEKLKQQEQEIIDNIKEIRHKAIDKLAEIRRTYMHIAAEDEEDKYDESSDNESESEDEIEYSNSPLSMLELMHKREKYMTKVYKKISDLESRAQTTSSSDYLRGLTEIRELQIILNNPQLKYFYNHFVSYCNEIFNDCCLANQAILENTAEISTPLLTNLKGIQLLNDVLSKNKRKLLSDDENTITHLENIVVHIQSLPDREVVIMQIARHLSLSLPFRSFITGKDKIIRERLKRQRLQQDVKEEEEEEEEHHLLKIDKFINNKIREWIGSILNIYGNNTFSSVKLALENDVVAQVRSSYAAKLIVNCVYGLDVSL